MNGAREGAENISINTKGDYFSGNAFVTKKGTLQIRKTEIKDGGFYTCMGKKI